MKRPGLLLRTVATPPAEAPAREVGVFKVVMPTYCTEKIVIASEGRFLRCCLVPRGEKEKQWELRNMFRVVLSKV